MVNAKRVEKTLYEPKTDTKRPIYRQIAICHAGMMEKQGDGNIMQKNLSPFIYLLTYRT